MPRDAERPRTLREQLHALLVPAAAATGAGAVLALLALVVSLARGPAPLTLLLLVVAACLGAGSALTWRAWVRVLEGVLEPLDELVEASHRLGAGDSELRPPLIAAADLNHLGREMGVLARGLAQERRLRAADDQRVRHQTDVLRQLLRLTQAMGGSVDRDRLLSELGQAAMTIGGHARAVVWFRDPFEERLLAVWDSVERAEPAEPRTEPVRGSGPLGRAAAGGQIATAGEGPLRRVAVPIALGLSISGVIELSDPLPGGEEDLDALEVLASHAATAVEAMRMREELERRSETDGLTRVFNRRRLDADVRFEVARAVRYRRPLALVMVDVDHFKVINDTFGHQQGDEVLKVVAATLHRECRATDGAYRYGGEEFAILLRDTDAGDAELFAERLRLRIIDGVGILRLPNPVTASLGVASVTADTDSPERLIEAADAALYRAKRGGRNRVVMSPVA